MGVGNFKTLDPNSKITNKVLVDFEIIMDLDLATVYYLITHCKTPEILDTSIGVADSLSCIRNILLFRKTKNPLEVCIKKEYKDSIDNLYKDLMTSYEDKILALTEPNDLFNYFYMLSRTDNLVNIVINCKTELQKNMISKIMPTVNTSLNERDLEEFDTLYMKYSDDIIEYKNIEKKKIYIANAMYNLETGLFKKSILLICDHNIVNTIDLYKNLTIPAIYNRL